MLFPIYTLLFFKLQGKRKFSENDSLITKMAHSFDVSFEFSNLV